MHSTMLTSLRQIIKIIRMIEHNERKDLGSVTALTSIMCSLSGRYDVFLSRTHDDIVIIFIVWNAPSCRSKIRRVCSERQP